MFYEAAEARKDHPVIIKPLSGVTAESQFLMTAVMTMTCMTLRDRTPGNGRGGLGRIRTDFVEILKKGQEPIRTKFHFFLKQPDPLSGRKSNFQDKCGDFISDRANPGKKNRKK